MLNHRRTFIYICFLFLLLLASPCVAEEVGFDVKELNKMADSAELSSKLDPEYLTLPGTNIKAGLVGYSYHASPPTDFDHTYKVMFMMDNKTIYYVGEDGLDETKSFSAFEVHGECTFGVYKDYFIVSCPKQGIVNPAEQVFLFRYGKDKVELLDVIGDEIGFSFGPAPDFMYDDSHQTNDKLLLAKEFRDVDGDGVPEILLTAWIGDFRELREVFPLYLEIVNDRLRVDLNPKLYEPFFEQKRKEYLQTGQKGDAYYITGFLSGMLNIDNIKPGLFGSIDRKLPQSVDM